MKESNKQLGARGEELAVEHLKRQGYRILEQNFRNRLGEIDIIAKDGGVVCFIEVKTRRSLKQGSPFEAVSRPKMAKLVQLAQSYIKYKRLNSPVRFDVVGIVTRREEGSSVEILKNAFDLSYIRV